MRIIFANNYYYLRGGSERVFFDEIKLLEQESHQIIPFTRKSNKNCQSPYSNLFPPALEYETAPFFKKMLAAANMMYSITCREYFSNLLEGFKPDLVHAHNIYGRLTTSVIDAAKKGGIPVVITLHDYKLICPSYLMLLNGKTCDKCKRKRFFHCLVEKCHKGSLIPSLIYTFESYFNLYLNKYGWVRYFICPSRFLKNKHAQAGIDEKKLIHIPNFINVDDFEISFTPGNYALFVGRLSREKGLLTLIKAAKGLDLAVKIVGEGPMRSEYEAYARGNKINNVAFLGYKFRDELNNLYKNAAFLVFPSEWYENASMTILESFAHGKPVIGSNIAGIPEMVIEGQTGLLFDHGNHKELREKMYYLLTHTSVMTEMGNQARKRVEEHYNAEIHYQKLMEVYEKACS